MLSERLSDSYPEKPCPHHPKRLWEWDGYDWICIDCILDSPKVTEVNGMRWLNKTDLFVNSEETDPAKKIVFRQVGWYGQSGKLYTMAQNPALTEKGSFSPMYIQIAPE